MEPVLTPEEMRRADEATIASGVPGAELMERAAFACATVALRALGGGYGRRAAVACGTGNNGGDGIACARQLAAAGMAVDAFLLGEPKGDAAIHLQRARRLGPPGRLRLRTWSAADFQRAATRADVTVDAVFGTGFSGEPRGAAAEAIDAIGRAPGLVLAVDIPSGVSGADGSVPGAAVRAGVTVAVQSLKAGHVIAPGAFHCGRLDVADIGIRVDGSRAWVPEAQDVRDVLPDPEPDTHKYRTGVIAVLAGSSGMSGAAILAATGALRAGAGLVLLGVPRTSLEVFEEAVVEAVKVGLPDEEGQLGGKAVEEFADRLEKADALAVGPGVGRGPHTVALVQRCLGVDLPLVVDGDGLWALGELLRDDPELLRRRGQPVVLTPHAGEYALLSGEAPAADRIRAAREAAARWGCVVHLKGRRAVTAAPDGRAWVNATGNPGMATGGTGDVLTGVAGTLCAQRLDPEAAVWAAAWLHGLAGDIATSRLGTRPMTAGDLAAALPDAFRRLGRRQPARGSIRTVLEDPER